MAQYFVGETSITFHFLRHVILNTHGMPDHVEAIWTIQADIAEDFVLTHPEVIYRLKSKTLDWHNYHSPLDLTLWISSIYHRKVRAGVNGIKTPYAQNKHYFSSSNPNLHLASIEDPRLSNELRSIIKI
jgi:hypothetical protein